MNFTDNDKNVINDAYKMILINLKYYLQQYHTKSVLEYSKIVFMLLHSGYLSINGTIKFDDDYNYIGLPLSISRGVQVMYGICCCRHATAFLYDLLCILKFNPSLMYIWLDNTTGIWHKVNPAIEEANHLVILYKCGNEYVIDPANKLILQIQEDGQLKSLDTRFFDNIKPYRDDNIDVVEKILKKYYVYRDLGIEVAYQYDYL